MSTFGSLLFEQKQMYHFSCQWIDQPNKSHTYLTNKLAPLVRLVRCSNTSGWCSMGKIDGAKSFRSRSVVALITWLFGTFRSGFWAILFILVPPTVLSGGMSKVNSRFGVDSLENKMCSVCIGKLKEVLKNWKRVNSKIVRKGLRWPWNCSRKYNVLSLTDSGYKKW